LQKDNLDIDIEKMQENLTGEEYFLFLGELKRKNDAADNKKHEDKQKRKIGNLTGKRKLRSGFQEISEEELNNFKNEILTLRLSYQCVFSSFNEEKRKSILLDRQLQTALCHIKDREILNKIELCQYTDIPFTSYPPFVPYTYIKLDKIDDKCDEDKEAIIPNEKHENECKNIAVLKSDEKTKIECEIDIVWSKSPAGFF